MYRDREVAFRVGAIPDSWRPIAADQAKLAFRDDQAGVTVAVGGRCGLDSDDVPLASLTQHLFIHFTDRNVTAEEESLLDGRAALRTDLTAKLDGVPRSFSVVVLKKDGCVYDFWLIAPPGGDPAARQDFSRFVAGFRTL